MPTDSQPLQKLPPVEPPQPALPPVIPKKPVLPPVTPVKPVLPPVMPVKPVLPPVTPVKPVLPPSPEVVEPPVMIPKPTCGVGFTEVTGVTCDATVPCPIGSQCVSGICCALIKPPVGEYSHLTTTILSVKRLLSIYIHWSKKLGIITFSIFYQT